MVLVVLEVVVELVVVLVVVAALPVAPFKIQRFVPGFESGAMTDGECSGTLHEAFKI